ncbi:MAG TPA: glycoside hydrolase family 15 protein [Stellaceae bacterium]|nr:glycoside hydrolase family 15 protein [Stellaceae bacterium]
MPQKIEDYGLIGDCETAALVARNGAIDWLCWPRFDSGACFAALLGGPEHGHWTITAADPGASVTRQYREDTLILETHFSTPEGDVSLIDFMPLRDDTSSVVRLVVGTRGRLAMRVELVLRFDYGALVPWVTRMEDGTMRAIVGPDMVVLRTPVALRGEQMKTVGEFVVSRSQTVPFVLTYGASHLPPPARLDPLAALRETETFWRQWAGRPLDLGEWTPAVRRSIITLKALTYRPTGGIAAAPTTSLPEQLGGPRNWDYRYCWLRDATLTLLAMMNCSYYEEAQAWTGWLLRAAAGSPAQLQIMYGLAGERRLTEWEVPWLPGYEEAKPVRIGNAAAEQLQLDVFGEVMDALYHARRGGLDARAADWNLQKALMDHLEAVWHLPDEGIWEVRGGRQHFTYSKVMAWVAFDRAIKSCEEFGLEGPVDRWRALRATIHDEVCREAFNPEIGAFAQSYGSVQLDASVLLLPIVGFLPPTDPRVVNTVHAVEHHLTEDGFVRRYIPKSTDDGLPGDEGAFLACSFWLVDNLVLLGRKRAARRLFKQLLALRNDLGLLSEEYDFRSKRLVGNFPQAFSHITLVNSAANLAHATKPVRQRSGHKPIEAENNEAHGGEHDAE